MNRRSVLSLGGLALAGSIAGCSALRPSEPAPVSVSEIVLRNGLGREIDVSVLLLDAGTVAFWRTVSVPATPNPFANIVDLPSESGRYELYAHVPATDEDTPVEADLTNAAGDQSCVTVGLTITTTRSNGEEHPTLVYGTIGDCENSE